MLRRIIFWAVERLVPGGLDAIVSACVGETVPLDVATEPASMTFLVSILDLCGDWSDRWTSLESFWNRHIKLGAACCRCPWVMVDSSNMRGERPRLHVHAFVVQAFLVN